MQNFGLYARGCVPVMTDSEMQLAIFACVQLKLYDDMTTVHPAPMYPDVI